jgi:RNA polymerase sigma-70 factor (ECF subfamily)
VLITDEPNLTEGKQDRINNEDDERSGEELFKLYLGGDTYAFERLIELYEDELARFIHTKVANIDAVKYLTIEAFGQLAVYGKKYAGKSSLKTYLFTIGKNLTTKYLKTLKKNDHLPYDEVMGILCDDSETPQGYLEREEDKQALRLAMGKLKAHHRTVLELVYFEEMSYKQAGEVMGKSEVQVKQLVYRAKLSLKKAMKISYS